MEKKAHKKTPMMAKKGTGSHGGRRGKWPSGAAMPASISFAESHKTIPANFVKKTVVAKPVVHHKKSTPSKATKKVSTTTKKKHSPAKAHRTKATKAVHHKAKHQAKKNGSKRRRVSAPRKTQTRRVSKVVYTPVPPPEMPGRWKINKWMVLLAVLLVIGIALIILWRLGYFDPIASTAPSTGPGEEGTTVSSEPVSSGVGRTIGILVVSFVVFVGGALLARRFFGRGRQMSNAEEELRTEINGNITRSKAGEIYIHSQALLDALIANDELTDDEKESVINRMLEVLTTPGMKKNMKLADLISEVSDAVENDFPGSLESGAKVQLAYRKALRDLPARPGAEDLLDIGEYTNFTKELKTPEENSAWAKLMGDEFKRRKRSSTQGELSKQEEAIYKSAQAENNQIRGRSVLPSFDDIFGLPKPLLRAMRDNKKFGLPGGTERVLLYGPAGTGKSQAVFAAAVKHDALILSIGGTEKSGAQGVVEKRIKDTFSLARKLMAEGQPVVVFLDEIDGLTTSSADARNELQRQIQDNEDVTVVATTNHKDKLGGPILSRLTKKVHVKRPDKKTRKKIINARLKDIAHNLTNAEKREISALELDGRKLTDMLNAEFARVRRQIDEGKDAQVTFEGLKEQFKVVKNKSALASAQRKAGRAGDRVKTLVAR